ncbi:MAG: hypothetical protein JRJ00_00795 [Deltaproteobacteria bacterium]|nr:hypothetical protein [Deltaproteobacteria bacterium]
MQIEEGTNLQCGCCGMGFQTWEGYEDQDQDVDYGICRMCQGDLGDRADDMYNQIIDKIRESLRGNDLAKFNAKPRGTQEYIATQLINSGSIKWQIGGDHEFK